MSFGDMQVFTQGTLGKPAVSDVVLDLIKRQIKVQIIGNIYFQCKNGDRCSGCEPSLACLMADTQQNTILAHR